jgi:hypothetical protein
MIAGFGTWCGDVDWVVDALDLIEFRWLLCQVQAVKGQLFSRSLVLMMSMATFSWLTRRQKPVAARKNAQRHRQLVTVYAS